MSIVLDGTNGISDVDGSAATPAIRGTDANTGIFFPAADTIAISEGGVESARFNSSGNLQLVNSLSVGNATPTTSGAGITFPATQSASSDANTLDDYEEGTWTPDLKNASSSSTWSSKTGRYTKIGRLVYCTFVVDGGNSGTAGSNLTLLNLPFTFGGTSNVPTLVSFTANALPTENALLCRQSNGSTSFIICDISDGNNVTAQVTFASGTVIYEV